MKRNGFFLAAAAAAVIAFAPGAFSPAYGQADGEEGEEFEVMTITDAIALARAGSEEGLAALTVYLSGSTASPEEVAALAKELIRGLEGDPVEVQLAAAQIAEAAEAALNGVQVVRFDIGEGYRPAAGTIGFDFGTADAPLAPGFERITAKDERVEGVDVRSLRRPSDKPVLSNGILGLKKFRTPVPNGTYRIVIMTDDLGEWQYLTNPLGKGIVINGVHRAVLGGNPESWASHAVLGGLAAPGQEVVATFSGGMLVIIIEITNGYLELELLGDEPTYLTGLLLEPVEEESDIVALDADAVDVLDIDDDERLAALVEIAEEIGEVLAEIITEAGEEVPFEEDPVSPS